MTSVKSMRGRSSLVTLHQNFYLDGICGKLEIEKETKDQHNTSPMSLNRATGVKANNNM